MSRVNGRARVRGKFSPAFVNFLFFFIETKKLKSKRIVNLQGTEGVIGTKGSPGSPGAAVSNILNVLIWVVMY